MTARPQWLVALHRGLGASGVPVGEMVAGGGQLRITVGSGELVATVRPAASGGQGWGQTRRFILGYDGARNLEPRAARWMQVILDVVRRAERHMPASLEQPGAIFGQDVDPGRRFAHTYGYCTVEQSEADGNELTEILMRTTDRCNQQCPFCSGPPTGHPDHEDVLHAIADAATAFPGGMLTITGGEPSLRRKFVEEVEVALATAGLARVHVQTNAVAFARKLAADRWPASDRLSFFVSLHASDEATYDACTGTTGQLPAALDGTRRLIDAGHQVFINVVVSQLNVGHLLEHVRSLAGALPWTDRVRLHFSILTCPEFRPEAAELVVPYRELAPALERAHAEAVDLGLQVQPLRSSTHASLPACVLGEAARRDAPRRRRPDPEETGYEDWSRPYVKSERCRRCVETETCLGVPRPYARSIGLDELQPLGRD